MMFAHFIPPVIQNSVDGKIQTNSALIMLISLYESSKMNVFY